MARRDSFDAHDPFFRSCLPLEFALSVEAEEEVVPASTLLFPDGNDRWYDAVMGTTFTRAHLLELGSFSQENLSALAIRDRATELGGVASYYYVAHGRVHVCAYQR